jgi:endo-1,4-beta-mannosidase
MAKAKKQTIDADGNIVEVEIATEQSQEAATFIPEPVKKKKEKQWYEYELTEKFQVNTVGSTRPPFPENYIIRNSDVIFDHVSGTEREIRYLEGVNTIWVDEQEKLSDAKKRQRPEIRFVWGRLRVPAQKTALVHFLNVTNMNKANPHRLPESRGIFKLVDEEAIEQANYKKFESEMNATELAKTAPYDIMLPHAKFLGINVKDKEGNFVSEMALRPLYYNIANKMSDTFIKTYNNPTVLSKFIIDRAVEKNIINFTHVKGQAVWSETKTFIVQIPDGKKPAEFVSEFCLTEKGRDFYIELKSMVKA